MGRVGEGGRALLVSVQHEEDGGVARFRPEGGRGLDEGGRSIVGVVEDEQRRQLALLRVADRLERRVGGSRAPGVEDRRPGALNLGAELGGKTRLADAVWAADERSSSALIARPWSTASTSATRERPLSASAQRLRSQRSSRSRPARSGEPPSS